MLIALASSLVDLDCLFISLLCNVFCICMFDVLFALWACVIGVDCFRLRFECLGLLFVVDCWLLLISSDCLELRVRSVGCFFNYSSSSPFVCFAFFGCV